MAPKTTGFCSHLDAGEAVDVGLYGGAVRGTLPLRPALLLTTVHPQMEVQQMDQRGTRLVPPRPSITALMAAGSEPPQCHH